MEVLINQLIKLKANRHRLEAKVFGGARVLAGLHQLDIGRRNADFVLDFLRAEKIPVMASDLEDTCPRKVAYFPRTGVVRMKRLVDAGSQKLVRREQRYKAEFSQAPVAGEVELFG
jgi:chemotaxis protein CheD